MPEKIVIETLLLLQHKVTFVHVLVLKPLALGVAKSPLGPKVLYKQSKPLNVMNQFV